MSVWGGENYVTERLFEVKAIAPGVGQIVCLEYRLHLRQHLGMIARLQFRRHIVQLAFGIGAKMPFTL
jgi:hypothetical protein